MTVDLSHTRLHLATASNPGAVAILHVIGPGAREVLLQLTGRRDWEAGRLYRVDLGGIDQGLAVLLKPGDQGVAQLMPHGGPRVVRSLIEAISQIGVVMDATPDPLLVYPEADSRIQADALSEVARAVSPAAIELLLAQPQRWRSAIQQPGQPDRDSIQLTSRVLDQLITPPTVVVVGRPNVGKSTLTNHLMGRSVSLVADLPGTTRDWVGGLVELGTVNDAVAVHWIVSPGLRASDDRVEQRAIGLASRTIESADVLIAMRDPQLGWPTKEDLPREPDIHVVNKSDLSDQEWPDAIPISATTGLGIDALQVRVVEVLGLNQIDNGVLWAFSDTLRQFLVGDLQDLSDYLR